ncbi:MAG: flagellar filament capping protein FliD [Phycisphaerae bacterium]|nr:flagellar filament capping protein FliD [Phycisphaerae bacterium]
MSSLALGGILSGIDYDTLIAGMIAADYQPLARMQTQKADYESKQAAIDAIETQFNVLKSAASSMKSVENLRTISWTTTDTDIVDITAGQGAQEGMHSVIVNQLATSHRLVHDVGTDYTTTKVGTGGSISTSLNDDTVADADAAWFTVGASDTTYTFSIGGEDDIEVTFDASTAYTMNEVMAKINVASQSASGYDAVSVEGAGPYELKFTAKHRGAGELAVTGSGITELDNWTNTNGTDVNTGAFVYTYDSVTRTINTDADTTLADLRDLINNDSENPGITASIIQHNGKQHLVLAGNSTGDDYDITINDALTTINAFDTADFLETQTTQDAEYRVDGYPSATWMTSSSNTITDVLDDVTLRLTGTGTASVNVMHSYANLAGNLTGMVSAYNSLVDTIDEYTGYDASTGDGGLLQGDSTVSTWLTSLKSLAITTIAGFDSDDDAFAMLAQIGIEIDRYGHLELDSSVLGEALDSDPAAVEFLIGADGRGLAEDSYFHFDSALSTTKAGLYEVKVDFDATGNITAAWFRNEGEGAGDWRAAAVDGNTITGSTSYDEAGLSVNVIWNGTPSCTQTSDVRFQKGFAGAMYDIIDELLDSVDGPLQLRQDSYQNSMDDLDDKMETLEARLEVKEQMYQEKFARLEAALTQLNGQYSAYSALFAQLDSNMYQTNQSSS